MSTTQSMQPGVVRRGFGLKGEVRDLLIADYYSELIERIKDQNGTLTFGRLTFRLAQEFGFCYGVDFALNLVYETRARFKGRRIYLLSEILHNPRVNLHLRQMGIEFLNHSPGDPSRFADITKDDVVIIPAFGAPASEYRHLQNIGCVAVDTTCGSVMAVWKRVEQYAQEGITTVIHGSWDHEETRATSSRVLEYENAQYIIVFNKDEAAYLSDYIINGGDKRTLLDKFKYACSPGFDPDVSLRRIGLANQTTMLSDESLEIAELFRNAIETRYGRAALPEHFRHFDTICTATQKRQDAVNDLAQEDVDLMIVVGGYNSSNTKHLSEISSLHKPTYHISCAECILSSSCISHRSTITSKEILTHDWLPEGQVRIGLTAGASTPDRVLGEVIDRIVNSCY